MCCGARAAGDKHASLSLLIAAYCSLLLTRVSGRRPHARRAPAASAPTTASWALIATCCTLLRLITTYCFYCCFLIAIASAAAAASFRYSLLHIAGSNLPASAAAAAPQACKIASRALACAAHWAWAELLRRNTPSDTNEHYSWDTIICLHQLSSCNSVFSSCEYNALLLLLSHSSELAIHMDRKL